MANILRVATASAPCRLAQRNSSKTATTREFSALLTPLEEFPGIPRTSPTQKSASTSSITTLSNGLTVITETASSTSTISLTFPHAGSSSEHKHESGASLTNKFLSFKSGSGLSSAVILRNLENDGATPFATSGRFGATVGYTASKDKAVRLIPLLATSCSYEKWDVRDALASAKVEVDAAMGNAQTVLTESIFQSAFGAHSSAGKPYYSTGSSAASIQSFRDRTYILRGSVLAATGISDHESFVRAVEAGLSESKVGEATTKASAPAFVGTETRIHSPSTGYAHLALVFKAPSVVSTPLMNVLKQCITLSSNGAVSGFAAPGIIGVYGGAASSEGAIVADALCAAITTPPSSEIVNRAKILAKAEAMFALDDGSKSLAEYMTASVLESGSFSAQAISNSVYDSITAKDVSNALASVAKSKPGLAAVGDISSVPYLGSLVTKFG